MGACGIGGTFKDYDWRDGIRSIQQDAEYEHGHDYYNGAANNVSFRYGGDKSGLTAKQLDKYIDDRMDNLDKRDGEVIKTGSAGFKLITTEFAENEGTPYGLDRNKAKLMLRSAKRPAVLVAFDNNYNPKVCDAGTVAELKKKAHELLRSERYRRVVYIVKKDKYVCCKGKTKEQAKTSRKTDAKTMVLELNTYRYYGWAPC